MLDNILLKLKNNTALLKIKAVLSFLFNYIHKDFLWGIFRNVDEKFLKFMFVGVLNTIFAYSIYALFVAIGLIPNVALICQYILGILWNFKTTGCIVFKNNDNKLIFKFLASYIITFILNSFLLYWFTEYIHINDYLSQALLILPIAIISYLILKFWVFK